MCAGMSGFFFFKERVGFRDDFWFWFSVRVFRVGKLRSRGWVEVFFG